MNRFIPTRAPISEWIIEDIKDETISDRYLQTLPISHPDAFRACMERKTLSAAMRRKMIMLVRTGQARMEVLLERKDLTEDELVTLTEAPGLTPTTAETLLKHPNSGMRVIAHIAVKDQYTTLQRLKNGSSRSGQVSGMLRNFNTPTRLATLILERELSDDPEEIAKALTDLQKASMSATEIFLGLLPDWVGGLKGLMETALELE